MKKIIGLVFISFLITACSSNIAATESLPATLTSTNTPEPTNTPTIMPTPIGGSSPMIAFYGQDNEGKNFVFVGNLYQNEAIPLFEISSSIENLEKYPIKWSPDSSKVLFFNRIENDQFALFYYDLITKESSLILECSDSNTINEIFWSENMREVTIVQEYEYITKINLETGQSETIVIPSTFPRPPFEFGIQVDYNNVQYTSIYNDPEITTLYDLQSDELYFKNPDESMTKIASFSEGSSRLYDLFIDFSPDREYGILSSYDDSFFYLIEMSQIPYAISEDEMLVYNYYYAKDSWIKWNAAGTGIVRSIPPEVQVIKDENYSIMMAWSPDSQYYIVENSVFSTRPSDEAYIYQKETWHFDIRNVTNNEVIFTYTCPENINPLVYAQYGYHGFDVVWPQK